jgi:Phage portal protein
MGWWAAAQQVARDMVGWPRPITLDAMPARTFDSAPRPIDQVLAMMRAGGGRVTRTDALSVAAIQRARNELASIATLPLRLYRDLEVMNNALFRQMDPDKPNVVHMAMTIEDLLFEGIAWWQITAQDYERYPIAARRIDPCRVSLREPGKNGSSYAVNGDAYQSDDAGRTGRRVWIDEGDGRGPLPFPAELMIRFDSPNPALLTVNAPAIRRAIALDRVASMYANNPALREYFTDADDSDVPPMRDDEVDAFLAEYGSMRQIQPYGWIPSTIKRADVSSPSPRDLTLVELQRQATLELANGCGVDPEDLGVSTTSRTYFNSVDKKQDKVNRTYAPYMRAITDRLSMGDVTRYGQRVEFDLTDYLKSDPVTQAAYWKALQDMGVVDRQWIAGQAGIGPEVVARATPAPVMPAPITPTANTGRAVVARFDGQPAHHFSAGDFADAPAAPPTVDAAARTITGLAVPYNAVAEKYGLKYSFKPGSLEYSSPDRMVHMMDHTTPVGFHRSITDSADGPTVALAVLDGPEGSPVKAARDQLLYDAANGLYSGLSIGVDFSLDPADGDVEIDDAGVYNVLRATWRETSTTYMPAFDDARVTTVAASRATGGNMHCTHCGGAHAPNMACATYAAQLAAQTPATPAAAPAAFDYAALAAAMQAGPTPAALATPAGPTPVNAHHGPALVAEPAPYRFDRKGNLGAGSHDFSSDILLGWGPGSIQDQAARDRVDSFVQAQFMPGSAQQQFAITPANVTPLNYPQNHPEMYVDQLDFQYPIYEATYKGPLDNQTPFVLPKFSASSGLVADHVSGTEPTPGAFSATSQTITPSAVSGKVEILRETFDQGGNPQASGLIWNQMRRGYFEALEAFVIAQLVSLTASIPDLLVPGTAAADSVLDQALSDLFVPLQYIRGGDRFSRVFTQIDLYKSMVKAKDTAGRRLYPSVGPMNSIGTQSEDLTYIDAFGKRFIPAWATAATSGNPASSYMFDPAVVCLWASAPQRLDIVWRVAWVDLGLFGYKAFAITDFTRTRELIYDPV